jgi:hypothetical protein
VRARAAVLAGTAWLSLGAVAAGAQTTEKTGEDPTRPVFVSIRPEFYRADDDSWRFLTIGRYDRATLRKRRWLGGERGLLLRFELPMSVAERPTVPVRAGIGDAYAQALAVRRGGKRLLYVIGSGLSIPTATNPLLGSGKWIVAPAGIPLWIIPRGFCYVKVQNFTSFAGAEDRPDVNFLLITPTLLRAFGRASWVLVDTETKTDWRRERRTGVKSGVQLGHVVSRGLGLWIKPEVWWGANQDGNWDLKTGIVWYR